MATTGTLKSPIATAQTLALTKGPSAGSPQPTSAGSLQVLDAKITMAVDHTVTHADTIALGAEFLNFGKVPKGAKIIPWLSRISTTHTVAIAGEIWLIPLSGATHTVIASVKAQVEDLQLAHHATTLPTHEGSFLDCADCGVATEDSWLCFWPAADWVVASSIKYTWARIVYAMTY